MNGIEDDGDDCDMFSDTSSMNSSRFSGTSKGSGKSHRSSKNRRKYARKLLNLKEGNPFEDIALVDALHSLSLKAYEQQEAVRDLLRALIDFELDELGVRVQETFGKFLVIVKESLDQIWIPEMIVSGEVNPEENLDFATFQSTQHYSLISKFQSSGVEVRKRSIIYPSLSLFQNPINVSSPLSRQSTGSSMYSNDLHSDNPLP